MAARLTIHYKLVDGTAAEVKVLPAAIMAWERKYKTKVSKLADGIGMEDMMFLAWEAARFAGRNVPSTFDDFAAQVEEIGEPEAEPVDPTNEAASATS
jgi:hypothetical protein